MTSDDQLDLNRLCAILGALEKNAKEEIVSEALKKAALALSVSYIYGHKSEIENLYSKLDTPLSTSETEELIRLGIDPEK
jgi:hypothetical protein